jgi:hypothetical protein
VLVAWSLETDFIVILEEKFWESTFAVEIICQMNLLTGVIDGSLSLDERAKITAGWRPYVQQWIADHP